MGRFKFLACALVGAGLAAPALSQESVGASILECEVNGYDLIIRNGGDEAIVAGTAIEWAVRFSRSQGVHEVERDLEPGGRIYLTGALGASYLEPGTPCTIGFVEEMPETEDAED